MAKRVLANEGETLRRSSNDPEFLTSADLSRRIREVLAGRKLRLAVAFWGTDAPAELLAKRGRKKVKVLCDVSMGGTRPEALIDLYKRADVELKHIVGFHAKVYLSMAGMVVGSANASHNGIGFGGSAPGHREAGMFHHANSLAWCEASSWFDAAFLGAEYVGAEEIAWARKAWRRPPPPIRPKPGSILDMVRLAPDRYRSLGFFFEKHELPEANAADARMASSREAVKPDDIAAILRCSRHNMFTGLSTREVAETPQFFIEFWKPDGGRLRVFARQVIYRDHRHRVLYTIKSARQVATSLPGLLPALTAASRADDAQAAVVLSRSKRGSRFINPDDLIATLAPIDVKAAPHLKGAHTQKKPTSRS